MAKSKELVAEVKALGDEAWKFFVKARESARAPDKSNDQAVQEAYAATVAKFSGGASNTTTVTPPSNITLYDRDEFETTNPVAINKVFAWVAANMYVDGILPGDAPNSEAWGLLIWCRAHPNNMSNFYTNMYPKMLPNKTQLEQEGRFNDDGRELSNFIARIRSGREAAVLQGGAKRVLPKPAFS